MNVCWRVMIAVAVGLMGASSVYAAQGITDPTTGMELVFVKGGCYSMGDSFDEGASNEQPVHQVCVDDFYIGKYEVTQTQWQKLMGENPSIIRGDSLPVDTVSWRDAQGYAQKLSEKSGRHYRLPTEAEWEYAARSGGKKQKYSGGNTIEGLAHFEDNMMSKPLPVGLKHPNGLGLYDMSGNVWEWCQDWYGENYYHQSSGDNPQGPESGTERIIRGGCHRTDPKYMRTTYRYKHRPEAKDVTIGFRLVMQAD